MFWQYGLNKGGIKLVIGKADGKQATSTGNVVFSQHLSKKKKIQSKLRRNLQLILFFLFKKRQVEKTKYCCNFLEVLYLYYKELEENGIFYVCMVTVCH